MKKLWAVPSQLSPVKLEPFMTAEVHLASEVEAALADWDYALRVARELCDQIRKDEQRVKEQLAAALAEVERLRDMVRSRPPIENEP